MTQTAETRPSRNEEPIEAEIIFSQEERRAVKVHLSNVIPLSRIPGAELAVRPINEAHVQSLMRSKVSSWPAIRIAASNLGLFLVDGYQRQEAAIRLNESVLDAVVHPYASVTDVIEDAFRTDLNHGLKPSEQRLGDYAFWLYCTFKGSLTQEEIAVRAEMSQPGVSKAIAKRLELLQEEALDEAVKQQLATERTFKRFSRGVVRFASEVETVKDEDALNYLKTFVKENELPNLARLGQLLMQVSGKQ